MSNDLAADEASYPKGVIGESVENGNVVIWKFVNEAPTAEQMEQLPWLTVISWKYEGGENGGLPAEDVYNRMVELERAIETRMEASNFCTHANSRTGNGLKELVYYIKDRDAFIEKFNAALHGHPRYPIEINFYHDPEWSEFHELLKRFNEGELPAN